MTERILVDTGAMIALFSGQDQHHERCSDALTDMTPPLLTCWPVVTEAAWLLHKRADTLQKLFASFDGGLFALLTLDADDLPAIASLMKRYESSACNLPTPPSPISPSGKASGRFSRPIDASSPSSASNAIAHSGSSRTSNDRDFRLLAYRPIT